MLNYWQLNYKWSSSTDSLIANKELEMEKNQQCACELHEQVYMLTHRIEDLGFGGVARSNYWWD